MCGLLRNRIAVNLLRVVVVGAFAQLSGMLIAREAAPATAAVCFAGMVALLGVVLGSSQRSTRGSSVRDAMSWSAALGAAAGLLVVVNVTGLADLAIALRLAAGTAVLSFALSGLARLLVSTEGDAMRARLWIVAGLAALAFAPIWLGPLVERIGGAHGLVDGLVATNPITFLAVLGDTDYLRAQWFYSHSPLGSLRFDYPGRVTSTAGWMTIGVLFTMCAAVVQKRRNLLR